MKAIKIWLPAIFILGVVMSLFHVPLIQMWKKQDASATTASASTEAPPANLESPQDEAEVESPPPPSREEGASDLDGEDSNEVVEVVVEAPQAAEPPKSPEPSPKPPKATKGSDGTRQVTIGMYPNMHFSLGRFVVEMNERLTVEFVNDDPQAQPHNLVFTKPGRRMKVFADMMRMGPRAVSSGYIPTKSRSILKSGDDVVAISLLNPGESGSVTFNAPEKPGAYPFACIYPGHQVSMYGVMHVVEDKANPNLPEEGDDSGIPPGWNDAKNAAVETPQISETSGGDSSEQEDSPEEEGPRQVTIGMYPNMHFSLGRFVVEMNERLTVEFVNDDPQAQPHNLVFTKPGRRMKVFADMMRMGPRAVSSGYIPTKSRSILKSGDDVVAISLLNPGESGSVTFNAPEKPGAYPFACIYPGHQVSMYGVMHVVEDPAAAELPAEDADPGIPPGWNDAKNAANGEGAESASSSVSQEADTVVRMFMPDSGPASIAVATPEGVHYCWDAGTMQLRYAWTGDFLDPSNHFAGNGDALARVPGHIVWRNDTARTEQGDRAFVGYRLEQGRPVFRWTMNGDVVEERIRPVAGALLEQRRTMAGGVEAVNLIEADPTLPRWYWSMDDTVRPTGHKPERLPAAGLVGRALPFREKAWKCGATVAEAGTIDLWCRELQGTPVLSFDHRDADRIQAVVLGENSLGVRGGRTDSATSSREQDRRDGWTRVTVRWDANGTTVEAGGWSYASGAQPKGGIVIGGDDKVAFGGWIDEVRVWDRRLSDEELDA